MHQTLNRWATLIWFRSGAMKRAAYMHGMFLTLFVTFEILFVIKALRVGAALSAPEKEHES